MADEPNPTPAPAPTPGNAPEARTPTGEIKDNQTPPTPSPETKQPEAKAPEPGKEPAKEPAKAAEGVPEKYDFKVPDGYELDTKFVEEVSPILKELGLNQDQAQKLADLYSKHSIESSQAAFKAYEDTRTAWRGEVAKDPVLGDGKEGLKPEVSKNINAAFQALGDQKAVDAFKAAMDLTGAGDNPAFVAAMNTFGKLLSEGSLVKGGGPSPAGQSAPGAGPRSAAAAMYPNLPTSSARP